MALQKLPISDFRFFGAASSFGEAELAAKTGRVASRADYRGLKQNEGRRPEEAVLQRGFPDYERTWLATVQVGRTARVWIV